RFREIAAAADAQTRSYAARVALDDQAAAQVALGQSARVYLGGAAGDGQLRVPLAAVQRGADGSASVWVVREGKVVAVPVQADTFGSEHVLVRGLSPQDWVVAAGGHLLREGQPVRPVDRNNRPVAAAAPAKGS